MSDEPKRLSYKDFRNSVYPVNDVYVGYNFWFDKLLSIFMQKFKYLNLPSSLPAREIESNLTLTGHCVLFRDSEFGIVTCETMLSGFDKYYNPTIYTYAQPVLRSGSNSLRDGKSAIIYNCNLDNQVLGLTADGSSRGTISRYARMLADIESNISIYLVNKRVTSISVASDSINQEKVNNFYNHIEMGKRYVMIDNQIIPKIKISEFNCTKTESDTLNDLLLARDKILEMFFRELGVRFYQPKKAQVNSDEISASDEAYLSMYEDMYDARKRGIEELNKVFNLNVEVYVNDRFNIGREFNDLYD